MNRTFEHSDAIFLGAVLYFATDLVWDYAPTWAGWVAFAAFVLAIVVGGNLIDRAHERKRRAQLSKAWEEGYSACRVNHGIDDIHLDNHYREGNR